MEVYSFLCVKDKIKTLEIELDEERSSVELLNDRISRSRDQVPYGYTAQTNKKEAFPHNTTTTNNNFNNKM